MNSSSRAHNIQSRGLSCIPRHIQVVHASRRPQNLVRSAPGSRRAAICRAQHSFVLYTKPECPLCDGLKDKLQALIDRAAFMPSFLTGSSLEVRDISTNVAWQDAMHLSVPVLAVLDTQDQEVVLARPQPRISADRLQQHLQQALQAAGVSTDSSSSSGDASNEQPFTVIM